MSSSSSPSPSLSSSSSSGPVLIENDAPASNIDEATLCPACSTRYDAQQRPPMLVADAGLSFTACRVCVHQAIDTARATSPPPTDALLPLRNGHTARIPLTSLDVPPVVDVAALSQSIAVTAAQNTCSTDDCCASAVRRCDACVESYCAEHATWHTKISALRSHKLVDIHPQDAKDAALVLGLASTLTTCPQHAHLAAPKFMHWCNGCERPMCVHCKADHAREHPNADLAEAARAALGQQVVADTVARIESMVQGCSRASESADKRSRFVDAHCEHVVARLNHFLAHVAELVDAQIRRTRELSHERKQMVGARKRRLDASLALLSSQLRAIQEARDAGQPEDATAIQVTAPLMLAARLREVLQRVEGEVDNWHHAEDYQSVQFALDETVTEATATVESIKDDIDVGASRMALEATAMMSELKRQLAVQVKATEEDERVLAASVAAVGMFSPEEQARRERKRQERERQERERQEQEREERGRQERERQKRERQERAAAEHAFSKNLATVRRLVQQNRVTTEMKTAIEAMEVATRSAQVCQHHVWVNVDPMTSASDGVDLLLTMDDVLNIPRVSNTVILAVCKIIVNVMLVRTLYVNANKLLPLVCLLQSTANRCYQDERAWAYRALLALPGHGMVMQTADECRAAIQEAGGNVPVLFMHNALADCDGVVRNVELFAKVGLRSMTLRGVKAKLNQSGAFMSFGWLRKVPQLTSLDVSFNYIGDEGFRALASSLQRVPQLRVLNVWGNKIGAEGCRALASSLQHVSQLTSLNGWLNTIGDEGCLALASSLHYVPQLTSLNLSRCTIGDAGMAALAPFEDRVTIEF